MTYDEALEENPIVSRAIAERECHSHGVDIGEMVAELGDHQEYAARDLLIWLGY